MQCLSAVNDLYQGNRKRPRDKKLVTWNVLMRNVQLFMPESEEAQLDDDIEVNRARNSI